MSEKMMKQEKGESEAGGVVVSVPRASRLLDLPHSVLGLVWPADRVAFGRKVCRYCREHLLQHVQAVELVKSSSSASELESEDIAWDLKRYRKHKVGIAWNVRSASCMTLLRAVSHSETGPTVSKLQLHALNLHEDIEQLSSALQSCSALSHLDLSMNRIGDDGMVDIANALVAHTALTFLDLSLNGLRAKGMSVLAPVLTRNKELKWLGLNDNLIAKRGVTCLANALQECTALQHLGLSKCAVFDAGASLLSSSLRLSQCPLAQLDLSYNFITETGADTLVQALTGSSCSSSSSSSASPSSSSSSSSSSFLDSPCSSSSASSSLSFSSSASSFSAPPPLSSPRIDLCYNCATPRRW